MAPVKKKNNAKMKSLDENKNESISVSNTPHKYVDNCNVIYHKVEKTENSLKLNNNQTDYNFEESSSPHQKTFHPCKLFSKIFPDHNKYKKHKKKCSSSNFNVISTEDSKYTRDNAESVTETDNLHNNAKTILSPNENTSHPCLHCIEVFPTESMCKLHIQQCVKKRSLEDMDSTIQPTSIPDLNVSSSDQISEEPVSKQPKYDLSIYDYDEIDSEDEIPKGTVDNKCKFCNFVAENAIELLKHKRELHKATRRILPVHEIRKYFDYPDRSFCPICEQPIKTKNFRSIFIKHLLVHVPGMPFKCRICKKSFRRLDQMKGHEKRHVVTYAEVQALQETINNDKPPGDDILLPE